MLQFLRAHQKGIFLCVAVVIICSFSFFGTYGTLESRRNTGQSERVIGYAIDGSEVKEGDIEDLCHLLNGGGSAFFAKEFIATGLGMMVADRYLPQVEGEIQERLTRAARYVPYAHKEIPFLNVQMIWNHFVPGMVERVAYVQKGEGGISSLCGALFLLYIDQMKIPPDQVKNILNYYMAQYGRVKPDPRFAHYDCALFGFHSLEDWFGRTWLHLMARVIINGSIAAERSGYRVSMEEALAAVDGRERDAFLWKKVMQSALYFSGVGRSVLLDPLVCSQFTSYAQQSVHVELFELPEELRFQHFSDLLKARLYAEVESIPFAFVEKKYPELIEEGIELAYQEVSLEALASEVSLKEMWAWQVEDAGWRMLVEKQGLPSLEKKEERFAYLEKMEPKKRLEVDACSQAHMLSAERIDLALSTAEEKRVQCGLRRAGTAGLPFARATEDVVPLLRLAALQGEEDNEASLALKRFSSDGSMFYKICVLQRDKERRLASFVRAMADGSLQSALQKKLKEAYPEVRKRYPASFKEENGQWRPFEEVQERVGFYVYADFLQSLLPEEPSSLDAYVYACQGAFMHKAREYLKKGEAGLYTDGLWRVEKTEKLIARGKGLSPAEESFLQSAEGEIASIEKGADGSPCFAKILRRSFPDKIDMGFAERVQSVLDVDARRFVWNALLQEIDNKKAI